MKNEIIVIFSSHLSDEENQKFSNHVIETIGNVRCEVHCFKNFNEYSLPQIYNKAIDKYNNENAIMVFCHNDIVFKTKNWGKLLLTKFKSGVFDIIGVAGSIYLPESGMWWEDRSKMCGVVEHTDGINTWVNTYAEPKKGYTMPVVLIDGLFIAVDCNNIENKFDENFTGFHFYDLSFCIPNYLDGCNIGVTTDIRILHKSIGMTNDDWEFNRQQFIQKYKHDLPLNYEE